MKCICGGEDFQHGTVRLRKPNSLNVKVNDHWNVVSVPILCCNDCGLAFLQFDTPDDFAPFKDEEVADADAR